MEEFLTILVYVLYIYIIYGIYQLFRNNKIYLIRIKWINDKNYELHEKYSYDEMFYPCRKNWYGLRWPNEKHYK